MKLIFKYRFLKIFTAFWTPYNLGIAVRLLFLLVLLWSMSFGADTAHADLKRTCVFVETVAGLPDDLKKLRAGNGDVAQFKRSLGQALTTVRDDRRLSLFSTAELTTMKRFLNAVRNDWRMNRMKQGNSIPGLSSAMKRDVAAIASKFGCKLPEYQADVPLVAIEGGSVDLLTVLLTIAGLLLLVIGILKLMRFGQRDERRICRVPAQMRVGSKSFSTEVMNISRGGVMVQAPDTDTPISTVSLDLPGISVAARVAWTNSNFAGLVFDKKLPKQKIDEILSNRTAPAQAQ